VTTYLDSLDTLDTTLGTITTDIATLDGRADTVDTTLSAYDGRLDTLEGQAITFGADILTLDGRVDTIDGTLTAYDARLDALESSTVTDGDLDNLRAADAAMAADIVALTARIAALEAASTTAGLAKNVICVSAPYPLAVPVVAGNQADMNRRLAGTMNSLAQQNGAGNVGDIKALAGNTLPKGWLFCDGAALSRISFPQLFAEIGLTYTTGDDGLTFNVPTQAQSIVAVAATTPTTTVDAGGSVTVDGSTTPPPSTGSVGSGGGNTATGGRPRPIGYVEP
jgi:hypothetical protein